MKIAIAQVNPTVGDLDGNRKLVEEAASRAAQAGADLVVLPEMVLTGYPPMDLLERDGFVEDQLRALSALAASSRDVAIALGAVIPVPAAQPKKLSNAAVILAGGEQIASRAKSLLPTYDVFDEKRYFVPGDSWTPADLPGGGEPHGLAVCEDTWTERIPK
jgi:NAD+ synthase (glutamine-hydrolysing)